jgi:hypothetical protein
MLIPLELKFLVFFSFLLLFLVLVFVFFCFFGLRASPPMYPYLYDVKLLVNEIDLLVDNLHLLLE